jgi:hypothetical protein
MRPRTIKDIAVVMLFAVAATAGLDLRAQPERWASQNTVARGEVVLERDGVLKLNITPCANANERQVVVFRHPYNRSSAGTIQCGKETKALSQVIQQ